MNWLILLCLSFIFTSVSSNKGFGPGKQDYGYITVRDKAHMFWWLFHTTANVSDSLERPLIMWLHGGPGESGCGSANFITLGPLDLNLKPREHTWVKDFNILFVDNPVGTGYSYVEDPNLFARDNEEIAKDLIIMIKGFYEKLPQFKKTPLYVYGNSYGGRMAVDFVKLLHQEIQAGNVESNISGVVMSNSWISPIDSTLSWAPYLYQLGLVDETGENEISHQARVTKKDFDEGKFKQAYNEWLITKSVVENVTDGANFFYILNNNKSVDVIEELKEKLYELMNGPVKEALNIPKDVVWSSQRTKVYNALITDFMKPVTQVVESLLNNTNVKVHIINGNLDLIISTPGQLMWVNRLRWPERNAFLSAPRNTIWINNLREGYEKSGGKFAFFWVNTAGHSVPYDNIPANRWHLKSLTGI